VNDLIQIVGALEPVDDREAQSIAATVALLELPGDHCDEERDPVHVTGSAFVVSSRGVILHKHKKLGIWVQPGGHVDPGESPAEAAASEAFEETGLAVRHLDDGPLLVHVDVHPGPRGHTHHDLRYLLIADAVEPAPPPEESQEVAWFDFPSARERCEPALVGALGRVEQLWRILGLDEALTSKGTKS